MFGFILVFICSDFLIWKYYLIVEFYVKICLLKKELFNFVLKLGKRCIVLRFLDVVFL